MDAQQLAALLRARRIARGLSQRDLATLADMAQPHVSQIERGGVDLRLSSLTKLADVLGMRIEVTVSSGDPHAPRSGAGPADPVLAEIARQVDRLRHQDPDNAGLRAMQAAVAAAQRAGVVLDPAHRTLMLGAIGSWSPETPNQLRAARRMLERLTAQGAGALWPSGG